ncbi:MAG: endolytic transglycosylase MltG [Spirochaetota bacterium]
MASRRILIITAGFIATALIAGAALTSWAYYTLFIETPESQYEYTIEIPQGSSFRAVSSRLADDGVVSSELLFRIYARLRNLDSGVRAGVYRVDGSTTAAGLLDALVSGRTIDLSVSVTVPEGWSVARIAERLDARGIVDDERFLSAAHMSDEYRDFPLLAGVPDGTLLEGFLFPETYRFEPDSSARFVVRTMLTQFHRAFEESVPEDVREQWSNPERASGDLREVLTLASIVEAESPVDDMPLVAGVFSNRIRDGWRLESDATVNYALGTKNLRPTYADVLTQHPYNTYRFAGLPPGPINNPGMNAILASISPMEHEYYFFLHRPDLQTIPSRTYQDHLAAIQRYLD